jgi:hypothetical protein
MFRKSRWIVALVAAAAIALPVHAHINSNRQLDTNLVVLEGEVVQLSRSVQWPEDGSTIVLLTKNVNKYGQPAPGVNTTWAISADTDLLKSAGIWRADLTHRTKIKVSGYKVADDRCTDLPGSLSCYFAGRVLTLETGCSAFIGRSGFAFGRPATAWAKNIPEDGLDKTVGSKCQA